ncbi:MAG: hypothetical protein U1E78_11035 [Gammaproteobacteria bacterium]
MLPTHSPKSRKEREVWQVCDALEKISEKITYQAVGDHLLKLGFRRGSNSDLCRYISTWRKSKAPTDPIHLVSYSSSSCHAEKSQSWQKEMLEMLTYHQTQFDKLFSALQKSKKINSILQKKLYQLTQRHKKLKKQLRVISRGR